MRIAALQMKAAAGDVTANLARIDAAAQEAAAGGARLLVAPELATTGYGAGDVIRDLAEPLDGPQVNQLAAISQAHGLAVVAGFAERDGSQVFNSLVLVDGTETPLAYRKMQLYADYERALFSPGPLQTTLCRLDNLTFGFLICYDVEFPEAVRALARAGADAVLVPTALPRGPFADFIATSVVPVRAFENQLFVAYANHAGQDDAFTYAGLSRIVGPDGTALAAAGPEEDSVIFADIDPAAFAESRTANTYLTDLRKH
ncbi:carbon-nitrogen hydrolase family protein [Pelagibius sp.]|uniref:carbon-nitrogen hydrolase family protein n=1 Tax=Pelagibius sp. TaxID=1931238 RepID=UPI002AC33596|nr:carbon-nitrogen hydrolase family protein [Pelagibius sp.]